MIATRPSGGRGSGGQPEGAGDAVLLGGGENRGKVGGLLVADARGQAILPRLDQFWTTPSTHCARLALAEDDFGKAAALAALQIDVGEAEVGDGGLGQFANGGLDAELARLHLFQQFSQIEWFQESPLFSCGAWMVTPLRRL